MGIQLNVKGFAMIRWSPLLLCLAAPLAGCASAAAPQEEALAPSGLTQVPLTIRSATGEHRFTVEVAGTPAEQSKGMMFRREMAADRGMIFPFSEPRMASFWMENTYLPLDLIFIRADGTVESIGNGVPLDQTFIESGEEVTSVLELNGGTADRLGIAPGDRVKSLALDRPAP